ncbi:catechol 1,2-dioxygenase [Beijerinckia mobilis]|uniref:catechol 1,2-dioxygenase n=1 Tax=Beijerinckia mobilis TaxID=231434 RepID=UPI00054D5821|nr:catechol 1,2-dioxygenase [Beijerinckia mobilis]
MTKLTQSSEIEAFLDQIAGVGKAGEQRVKTIVHKIVADLFETIDQFDVTDDEFWHALNFVIAGAPELGLWAAGLGLERFLDLRADLKDQAVGFVEGTPRTIEGPLYVAGAPLEKGTARLDDGNEPGEVLIMQGRVRDTRGNAIAGAIVDVWHANTKGNYSYFDKTLPDYNLRRRIETDANGHYIFRSIVPSGYAVPSGSNIEKLLTALGRHGNRPAHIHFFISAPGYRHLTTQINIEGDPYLHDDFAYATKDALIPPVIRHTKTAAINPLGLNETYSEIVFDFVLNPADVAAEENESSRARALADA